MSKHSVAVASRPFSLNERLRQSLLDEFSNVRFNDEQDYFTRDALTDFLAGCDMAIVGLERIDEELLFELPDLRVISKFGVGLNNLDLEAMSRRGIRLGWTAGVVKRSVSELVIAAIIMLLHRSCIAIDWVERGQWKQIEGIELTGQTVGIIGCGNIGKDVVRLLQPFDCRVLAYDIRDYSEFYRQFNVTPVEIDVLLKSADIVTVHTPLDSTTRNILCRERLAKLRSHAVLLNYARGGLVDEEALISMLDNGKIGGVALDVLAVEPPNDLRIASRDNVMITPHIGGSTRRAILDMGNATIRGLSKNIEPKSLLAADEDS